MRTNVIKIKLIGIPDCHTKGYRNILERVCRLRTIREIGDIESVNHTVYGKVLMQGFKVEIIK